MSMSEDLRLLKQLGLSLVLRNGQWYCGQFGGDFEGDEGYLDEHGRIDGLLYNAGVADTIPKAIALAVVARQSVRQRSKN
jgi:hypothetical protein